MNELADERLNIKRKVLVVDDEIVNRQMLGKILGEDYEVHYASNGMEALEKLRDEGGLISLMLLDLMMPEKDGYAVMEEMKADK